jgi:dihydroflavonol-4-reductase
VLAAGSECDAEHGVAPSVDALRVRDGEPVVTPLRVLVTGGSGFIGAHSARALAEAGHSVRFLARSPERLARALVPLGVPLDDTMVGDVTDEAAVRRALEGCDAVLHAAAVVATGSQDAAEMVATNVGGTRAVLGAAAELGLDPIVHVSSGSALYPTTEPLVGPDSPVVEGLGAYGKSKARAERFARRLQAQRVPVVCTYPMMVLGPPAGDRCGESATAFPLFLRLRVVTDVGHWVCSDVRDVAAVHAAAMTPGLGPRRYTCGGHFLTTGEAITLLEQVTGHTYHRVPVPERAIVALGGLSEFASRVAHQPTPFTHDGMVYLTHAVPFDDRRTVEELGIGFRDPLETIRATVRGLLETGAITAEQAGRAAR